MKQRKPGLIRKIFGYVSIGIGGFLSFLIILNAALPAGLSGIISSTIFIIAGDALNPSGAAPVVNVTEVNLSFYSKSELNNIDGYKKNEIPVGATKAMQFSVKPNDATNTNFTYACTKDDVTLTRSGNILYVQPNSLGEFSIEFKSVDGEFSKTQEFKAVDLIAPKNINLQEENIELVMGKSYRFEPEYLSDLMKDPLMSVRYYDVSRLSFTCDDESVAKVDEYGVISSSAVGETFVTISDGSNTKKINVKVNENQDSIIEPSSFSLSKNQEYAYIQDLDYDRNASEGETFHTHLEVNWENLPTDDTVTFISSDPLVAKVDNNGDVRGYRKKGTTTITCFSNRNPEIKQTIDIEVKDVVVSEFDIKKDQFKDIPVGKNITLTPSYGPRNATTYTFGCESKNPDIALATSAGRSIIVEGKAIGDATIVIYPKNNPELKKEFAVTVVPYSIADDPNFNENHNSFRKIVGHFSLFMVDAIFLTVGFALLFFDNKIFRYVIYLISISTGLFLAGISEFIQTFSPGRTGKIDDFLIDSAGYVVGLLIVLSVFLTFYLVKFIVKKVKK